MQPTRDSVYVTPAEWRWVIVFASFLVILAFVPFLWVGLSGVGGGQWQFMGVLNNPLDGATYLSKMLQGYEGSWLIHFQHTPETHNAMLLQILYPLLGQLSRVVGIPPIALFHAARVVASLIMYMALYHFAATIWPRRRSRQIFFVIVSVGSGVGWLYTILAGSIGGVPDLTIPEIFPFYSSLVNVHFPLTIACLALLSSIIIVTFRPGCSDDPSMNNGGVLLGLLSFLLSLLYPQSLAPFGAAAVILVAFRTYHARQIKMRDVRWLLLLILPALPMAVYYVALVNYNPAAAEWNRQNVTLSPSPIVFLFGLGIPLLIALPGIFRSLRRFEPDGDQFIITWLIVILLALYLPTNTQRRFGVGLMIPIAYFATRALEGFWFNYISRRWRYRLVLAVIPAMTMSYLLVLLGNMTVTSGPFLQRDYGTALQWLRQTATPEDVVLAAPDVSAWVPGWTGARVVAGHPYETLDVDVKFQQALDWYTGANCTQVIQAYSVRYIIVGPQERELGSVSCASDLTPVFEYNSVTIYSP